jgi:hypothetical protein
MFRLLSTCVLASIGFAAAAEARNLTGMATAQAAQCEHQVVGGEVHHCPAIVNMLYDDGFNSFMFADPKAPGRPTVSFLGDGNKQAKASDGSVIAQPIVAVTISFTKSPGGKPDFAMLDANGSCAFGKPYRNEVIEVACTATTSDGKRFKGNFRSNGQPMKLVGSGSSSR